jgi:response regulator RpfG family c-di-GMP phosphodiesterase
MRLAFAAEFRDPTTGAHINRMSRTCELLAEGLVSTVQGLS